MLVPRCAARDCSPQAHAQLQLQSRHEKAPGEQKKKTPRSNTARVWLFLKQPVLSPALCQFTSHNTRFKQPNSCGFGPSQNTLVESPNVFLARAEPRQPEHNDIFRDRPWLSKKQCFWQMSQSAITKKKKKNQDTPSERDRRSTWRERERKLAIAVFRAKAIGEYQVLPVISATSPLSKHLQTRMHMQSRERVWRAHAVTKLITRKYILEKLPASPDRLQTRRAGQEVKIK